MYDEILRRLGTIGRDWPAGLVDVLDILLVAYLIYRLLRLVRGTRAWRVLIGVVMFVVALIASDALGLRTLHWILEKATLLGPVALVILFLPELRQAIEGFARIGGLGSRFRTTEGEASAIDEIVNAAFELAETSTGALMVLDEAGQLDDIIATGTSIRGEVSSSLLESIFMTSTPLHDGAIVIRGGTILAAACQLPLSSNPAIQAMYHMRHRAGVGITEQTEAISVIVSEERGLVTVAEEGSIKNVKDKEELRKLLLEKIAKQKSEGGRKPRKDRKQDAHDSDEKAQKEAE
ncbi:MAG: diadenylate cyclase CdaA [Fimbriimonadaceae bacterium]|nr:diadenylate cyclase CdaA [Fimbriimonadaceae bacterium]